MSERRRAGGFPCLHFTTCLHFTIGGMLALASLGCLHVIVEGGGPLPYEGRSLLGEPLASPEIEAERLAGLREDYATAHEAYEADPDSEQAAIWLGRRLAYLGRYRDAIDVYTKALLVHPESYQLLRHRGHRYITVRRLDDAARDLARAAELTAGIPDALEPDGQPNALGVPRSTTQSNIWYHLGLAYYLAGDLESALPAYRTCLEKSRVNDDMLVAATHWLWMTLARLGRDEEAREVLEPIEEDMQILENVAYQECLLLRKGLRTPEEVLAGADGDIDRATRGYGVAAGYLVAGEEERAFELLREIVDDGPWMAFGAIAAEAELARER